MYALPVQNLPKGNEWLYEVKFDGYRCLAGRESARVTLWSRRGNLFTKQFPHIAQACERFPSGTLVDGEIVALDASGRISFNLLQHHCSQAQALLFYLFDVLVCRGRSLLKETRQTSNVREDNEAGGVSARTGQLNTPIADSEKDHY
jgi:bifunctional non-homologous end joining protein LigD